MERHTSEWKFQSRASPTRSQKYVASIATMPIVRNTGILNLDQMPKRFEMNLNRVSLIETYADVLQTWTAKDLSVVSLLQDKIKKKRKKKKGSRTIGAADYEIIERNLFVVYIKDILWDGLISRVEGK